MEAMNILKEVSCEVLSACQSCILLYHYSNMEHRKNNKFGYTYLVNDESDLTPPQAHLEPMDVNQIVNLVQSVIESADATFYENNQDTAKTTSLVLTTPRVLLMLLDILLRLCAMVAMAPSMPATTLRKMMVLLKPK